MGEESNVISLAEKAEDNSFRTVSQLLEELLDKVKSGEILPDSKAFVITLNDDDQEYHFTWHAAKLSCSEILGLLEIIKPSILEVMGML